LRLIILFPIFIITACTQQGMPRAEVAMNTVCVITLFERRHDDVYRKVFNRIHEIENLMSTTIPSSDVSRVNAAAGIEPIQVHHDTFKVIKRAVYFAELSGGAFDPTVGPLVSLWGIGSESQRVPSQDEIDNVLLLVNWNNIELDTRAYTVFLKRHGMALDLGAIAKGYAADEAAAVIKAAGIRRAIVDLGGNIVIVGEKKDKSPWRVGIQSPGEIRGSFIGILQVTAKTIVTSGVYERYFIEDGVHYHHLFDPFSGYPVQNDLLSVAIITDISMDADALSTAVFVLGYENGMKLINTLQGVDAVFIFEDKNIRTTAGANFVHR
jgi:thiamine biosynthesis lipoprotein